MNRKINFGVEGLNKLMEGVNESVDSIKVTLGARGRNVIIETFDGGSMITNDGVTVARNVEFKDNLKNMGANLVREAAAKTELVAGDGTTTASILFQSMMQEGIKYLTAGVSPLDLREGMKLAVDYALKRVEEESTVIEYDSDEVLHIATTSANNDPEMGKLIADTIKQIGKDGVVSVAETDKIESEVAIVEGGEFDRGFLTPWFANNSTLDKAILDEPYILVTDKRITSYRDIMYVFDEVNEKGNRRPVLIVSDDIDPEVLNTIQLNYSQGNIDLCCIKAPSIGDSRIDNLRDIAAITGATYISEGKDMKLGEHVKLEMLGTCEQVIVDSNTTKIVGGDGNEEELEKLINNTKARIAKETDSYQIELLKKRLAKLTGGIAVFYIGAPTETEREEKKFRIDDSLQAVQAAIRGGVVPGGGVLLARISDELDSLKTGSMDERLGVSIIQKAIREPFRQIMKNAGESADVILNNVKKEIEETGVNSIGYDVKGREYCDMVKKGIIDPKLVTVSALENAASVASLVLTTEVQITKEEK